MRLTNESINNWKDPERTLLTLIMTGQARNKQEFSEKIRKSPTTVQRNGWRAACDEGMV